MKLRLRLDQACDLHNSTGMMVDVQALVHLRPQLESARVRIGEAIKRSRLAEPVGHGWKARNGDFARVIEFELDRNEVTAIFGSLLLAREKAGDVMTDLTRSVIGSIGRKLVTLGEDLHEITKETAAAIRGEPI